MHFQEGLFHESNAPQTRMNSRLPAETMHDNLGRTVSMLQGGRML